MWGGRRAGGGRALEENDGVGSGEVEQLRNAVSTGGGSFRRAPSLPLLD